MEKVLPELHIPRDHNLIVGYKNKEVFDLFYDKHSCCLYGLAVKSVKSKKIG